MEWLVDFEERRTPIEAILSDNTPKLVRPFRSTIDSALAVAAAEDIEGLTIVLYAGHGAEDAPTRGFKLVGSPHVVDYARRLLGDAGSIRPAVH